MNKTLSLIRAIRGPVQLIVLGVLFLLSYHEVAPVWRTWPVLLISFGLLKMAEWLYQRSLSNTSTASERG